MPDPELTSVDMAELRRRRGTAQEQEARLSYVRRMAQGRIDIVSAEMDRRRRGEDVSTLVTHLPEILGHEQRPSNVRGSIGAPPDVGDPDVTVELDDIAPPARFLDLGACDDDELQGLLERLAGYEQQVSSRRRGLHDEIDRLQEEIVRRYKTGEASIDSLLQ